MFSLNKKDDASLLSSSILFDGRRFGDGESTKGNSSAAKLYISSRENWRKDPSDFFDVDFYLNAHDDVRNSKFVPVVHYLKFGWREGRIPHPDFDRQAFLNAHPNVDTEKFDAAQACVMMYGSYNWNETIRKSRLDDRDGKQYDNHRSGIGTHERGDFETPSLCTPFVRLSSQIALTVVIPSYNRSALVKETASQLITAAGNDPIEIIVVDDGSSDDTPDVLRLLKFHHSQLRFERTKNMGPGPARNRGASSARGDVVLFLGDDTRPVTTDLFRAHYAAHKQNRSKGFFAVGKVVWPDNKLETPNFVMNLIQGDGQQQFGYKFMKPWQRYAPWLFYTANASLKADVVDDWENEGFSDKFTLYGFEDGEFAYRMSTKFEDFGVYYVPNAVVSHHHHYDVAGFIKRQVSCGFMMDTLFKIHPNLRETILDSHLREILDAPDTGLDAGMLGITSHYSTVIEGIKSWATILDKHHGLGSQNWHQDFLNAVFQLAFLESYVMLQVANSSAQVRAYQYLLQDFKLRTMRAVQTEVLGDLPNFTFF